MEKNLTIFLLLIFIQSISCERIRSSFGEFCNTTIRCDSRQSLTCKNETCQCLMKNTMIFDTELNKCAVLAGEKCSYTAVKIRDDEDNNEENEKVWKEELPCISNAQCLSGYCNCKEHFMESNNGSCKDRGKFGAVCLSDSDCRTELICEKEKCNCNSSLVYHPALLTCVKKVGQSCENNEDCTLNSKCERVQENQRWYSKCQCENTYFPSFDGTCWQKRNYGEACEFEEVCLNNLHLSCKNRTCQCNENSVLDRNKCVIKAGSSCKNTKVGRYEEQEIYECASNSVCRGNSYDVICECHYGLYKTLKGTCISKSKFNESCEEDGQCQSKKFLELECVEGRCACRNGGYFNSEIKKCVQLYNGTCHEREDLCVQNAHCHYGYSRCYCQDGFSDTSNGYCLPGHGTSCGVDHPCNTERGLICVDGKCQCEFGKHQYVENSSCISRVWGPCSANSSIISCTDNAECSEVTSGVNVCLCKEGFVSVDRECELAYGQACNQSIPCDRRAPLSCVEGTCKCSGNQYYDDDEMKCKGLFGAMCEVNKNDFCAGGTYCKPFRGFEMINFGVCNCPEGLVPSKGRKSCSDLKLKPIA